MVQARLILHLKLGQRKVVSLGPTHDKLVVIVDIKGLIVGSRVVLSGVFTHFDKIRGGERAISVLFGGRHTNRVIWARIGGTGDKVGRTGILARVVIFRLRSLGLQERFTASCTAETHIIELILFFCGLHGDCNARFAISGLVLV